MVRRAFDFRDKNDVLKTVNDPRNNVKFIRFVFPDILGRMMDFTIPVSELNEAFDRGKGFDGSSVDGFVRIQESDLKIIPDPKTARILPWTYQGKIEEINWKEAVIFGDIYTSENEHFAGDSRYVLQKILSKAKDAFKIDQFFVGPELEFFLFPSAKDTSFLDTGGYFFSGKYGEVRKEIQLLLNEMGIATEYDHHEVAHSQHEIDLKYKDAIEIADIGMLFRYIVKRVARTYGLYATFMPKPLDGQNGSGMHVHQSLWTRGRNMFFDDKDRYHLSPFARRYIAGLIKYGSQISLLTNQWVNSYKRLQPNFEAPVYTVWGRRNRSAYIRVPEYQKGRENATRIELRSPDPSCNLYLAFGSMFSAGLQGVKENLEVSDPVEDDVFSLPEDELEKLPMLPTKFEDAIDEARKSKLLKLSLGNHIFKKYMANKELELKDYMENAGKEFDKKVSPYELKRYLPWL